jgi:DNA excision repair protein ERCC-2
MNPPQEFRTTVRDLVEFVHRSGDLAGTGAFRSSQRAVAGTRGHRRIQQSRGDAYLAEVPVERIFERPGLRLLLTGRVDGILPTNDPPLVEEIKTVTAHWTGDPDPVHLAQLRTYAALLAEEKQWQTVAHQLTYLNLATDEITVIRDTETRESLSGFLDETIHKWLAWLQPRVQWLNTRNASLEALKFPFSRFRGGQRELARTVYRSVRDGKNVFLEAPTGLGKTLATLFPAVKALPLLGDGQIFYVTAKTPGRLAAAQALEKLRHSGARVRSLMLTAKKKLCFTDSPTGCDVRTCPYAIGYHDRIKPAVRDLLTHDHLDRETIERIAQLHQVCPFELSLDASLWTDIVVGDFNYVFDPTARLQRHFGEGPARHVVLIDEAHNLVDRSREMHSASLLVSDLAIGQKAPRAKGAAKARRALADASGILEKLLRAASPEASLVPPRSYHDGAMALPTPPEELVIAARQAARSLEELLAAQSPGRDLSGWLEPWFAITAFLRACEAADETCRFLLSPADATARLYCADPAQRIHEVLDGLRAAIFFSATLSPLEYFRDLLGGNSDEEIARIASPFSKDQMHLSISAFDVTFKGRTESLSAVARTVADHVQAHPGNHLIFSPSLQYQADLEPLLAGLLTNKHLFSQGSLMEESQRLAFLARFTSGAEGIGLAVLGGIFAEGVDLPGDQLIGVTVIGVGLPRLSLERDILLQYFAATRGEGFDYAYRFPGMQRVLQAVGRLIRSEEDRGAALLIDQRFNEPRYRRLFPDWWQGK